MNFKEFFEAFADDQPLGTVIPNHNSFGAVPSDWNDSQFHNTGRENQPHTSDFDLGLPETKITGPIIVFDEKSKNHILIVVQDQKNPKRTFSIPLTYAQYRDKHKLRGEARKGAIATVIFYRRDEDRTQTYGAVKSITIH